MAAEHWGAERAEGGSQNGMPKQEHANVMSDTVGKIIFSVIQHNSLSLRFSLPRQKVGIDPSSPVSTEAEDLRRRG